MNKLTSPVLAVLLLLVGFAAGRWTQRSHNYQRLGDSRYLLDTSTGKLCNPWKPYQDRAKALSDADPYAEFRKDPTSSNADPFREFGGTAADKAPSAKATAADFVPTCQ